MCADRDSCFALDAPRGTDGDPSSFYRIAGNPRPPGRRRAVRNAQVDPGRELDLGSASDNMTRVVVSSSNTPPPPPVQRGGGNKPFLPAGVYFYFTTGSLFIHRNRPQ